jgi:hypothetical protein
MPVKLQSLLRLLGELKFGIKMFNDILVQLAYILIVIKINAKPILILLITVSPVATGQI